MAVSVVRKFASGYNPDMLRIARDLRGETGASIARGTGIPPRKIYQYIAGAAEPTPEHLEALADYLQFPSKYFYRPGEYLRGRICGLPGFIVWDKPDTRPLRERAAAMLDSVPDDHLPELLAFLDDVVAYGDKVTRI